jgi:hypothetical protein
MKTKAPLHRDEATAAAWPFTVHVPELGEAQLDAIAELLLRWIDDGTLDRLEAAADFPTTSAGKPGRKAK